MTLSVQPSMGLADLQARHPGHHVWRSPGGRYYAARKAPAGPADRPMTLSADTVEELAEKLMGGEA